MLENYDSDLKIDFLHARPRIPDDEITIFTVIIHWWRSHLRQFARARTIDEYDVTVLVSYIRVMSQINCSDVTILNQKRLSLATTAKSAIGNCFGGIECSGYQIACKKENSTFVNVNNDFWVTRDAIWQWLRHSWKLLANRLTRDPKIVIHDNECISLLRRHDGRDGVSNHQSHDCLLNHSFRCRSQKTSKLRVTGLCAGNSTVTGEFPAQMASYAEYVSIWWRHHGNQGAIDFLDRYWYWPIFIPKFKHV